MPADSDIEIEKCSFIFLPHSAQLSSGFSGFISRLSPDEMSGE